MLTKPLILRDFSSISAIDFIIFFIAPGLRKGKTPSITNISAKATHKSCNILPSTKKPGSKPGQYILDCMDKGADSAKTRPNCPFICCLPTHHAVSRQPISGLFFSFGAFKIPEKFGIRIQHHHIAVIIKRLSVGIQTAVEGIEFSIFPEGVGIDLS